MSFPDAMKRTSIVVSAASAAVVVGLGVASAGATSGRSTITPPSVPTSTVQVKVQAGGTPSGRAQGRIVNEDLVGVDGPGPAVPTSIDATMTALGLRWVRADVGFEGTYDCRSGWNPAPLDERVMRIETEGAKPLLIVDYTPPCLEPFTSLPPGGDANYEPPDVGSYQGTSDKTLWDALVQQMAVHEIANGVCAFEVWNEPDGTFWYGSLAGYLNLYQDTATALEAAVARATAAGHNPCPAGKVEIGGPALLFPDSTWIEPFLAYVAGNHLPLDFLSWHYYGDYPEFGPLVSVGPTDVPPNPGPPYWYNPALRAQAYGLQVAQVRAEVAKYPTLDPKLWIDEWNVDAGYDARMSGPYDAAFAAAVLDSVQAAGLDRMAFFDVADSATDSNQNWGLLSSGGEPKPVYETFLFWHEMEPSIISATLSPSQKGADLIGRVGAVASRTSSGAVTVLLYNFAPYDVTGAYGTTNPTPYDHTIHLRLTGLRPRSTYNWTRALIDASHNGADVARGSATGRKLDLSFSLAGEGVTLITVVPSPRAAPYASR